MGHREGEGRLRDHPVGTVPAETHRALEQSPAQTLHDEVGRLFRTLGLPCLSVIFPAPTWRLSSSVPTP